MLTEEILFALLRFELFSAELPKELADKITPEILRSIYDLSKKHDVIHLVADALIKNGIIADGDKAYEAYENQLTLSLFRYEGQKFASEKMYAAFEEAGIDFIPLKGAVIRYLYPEPWMRTSTDIDVLVKKEDVDTAAAICEEKLGFTDKTVGPHDVTFFAQNVHIELHFDLAERNTDANEIMADVFLSAKKADGFEHNLVMDDAMLYLYHIVHIEKHFLSGGCGIRSIADLVFLDRTENTDIAKRNSLLKKAGLLTFANGIRELSKVWFENKKPTELTDKLGFYIIKGGIFGNKVTKIAIARAQKSGFAYMWKRAFPPLWIMKPVYPILKKYPILLPVMHIKRIFGYLKDGRAKESLDELKLNATIGERIPEESLWLMKKLDIISDMESIV